MAFAVPRWRFPDSRKEFPVSASNFPVNLRREFVEKPQSLPQFSRWELLSRGLVLTKFPVFSLMIREFVAETGSHRTASSASQASVRRFSATLSRNPPTLGSICISRGTRDRRIRATSCGFLLFLSLSNFTGAARKQRPSPDID